MTVISLNDPQLAYIWRCAAWVYGSDECLAVLAVCDFLVWGNR